MQQFARSLARSPILVVISVLLVWTTGCSHSDDPGPPRITAGTPREITSQQVLSSGGQVRVDRPGDSLNGLVLDVPSDAYAQGRTFRISESSIQEHQLGPDFNPITPLIRIENGGGYAAEPMKLRIPCHVPAGQFAMAFLYDRTTGNIEGMPLYSIDSTSITVLVSNFTFSTTSALGKSALGGAIADDGGSSEIVVSSVASEKLDGDYDSGFLPGIDDWQFTNYGSWIYVGHCSGQSTTMLWYYGTKKRLNRDPLYGRFDNDGVRRTPKLWQDDDGGYKFCGLAQVDLPWGTISQTLLKDFEDHVSDETNYKLFAYAIRITGQPQFVHITNGDPKEGGHAIVVYRAEHGILHIADPNYPGKRDRSIEYSLGHFIPYYSGPNAQNVGVKYIKFYYLAQSSIIDYSMIKRHYDEMLNGTIGRGRFPDYTLQALNDAGVLVPLTDGFTTKSGMLKVKVTGSIPLKIAGVYDEDQNFVSFSGDSTQLPFGERLLGFYITDTTNHWVGFTWVRVGSKDDGSTPPASNCTASVSLDDVPMSVNNSSFVQYPGNKCVLTVNYNGGYVVMAAYDFHGVGDYTSGTPTGANIVQNGVSYYVTYATLSVTEWDGHTVAGTFTMEDFSGSQGILKRASGTFRCQM